MKNARRGPKPRATYDGRTYICKSHNTIVPDFSTMSRGEVLRWMCRNTIPRGYSKVTNPLAGFAGAISVEQEVGK